jgi:hypothetical protein
VTNVITPQLVAQSIQPTKMRIAARSGAQPFGAGRILPMRIGCPRIHSMQSARSSAEQFRRPQIRELEPR